jgi:hypothetical protein
MSKWLGRCCDRIESTSAEPVNGRLKTNVDIRRQFVALSQGGFRQG